MTFDNPMFAELPPGQRLLRDGSVCIFDLDATNDFLAVEAHLNAPDDLSRLPSGELHKLGYAGSRITSLSKGRDRDLSLRVQAERARRQVVAIVRDVAA